MSSAGIAALSPTFAFDPILSPLRFEGSRSHHCFGAGGESILIYLTVPGGSPIPMRVLESDSIASVKLRIQSFKGFVVRNQRLVFGGRELARNNSLVRDYGVADGNVVHLVIRCSDLRLISVKTACGKQFEFHIERGRSVGYVKQQIAQRNSTEFGDVCEQRLICDGEELDDCRVINDICKSDGAVIHLLVRKPAKVRSRPIEKDFEVTVTAPEKFALEPPAPASSLPPITGDLIEPVIINPKIQLSSAVVEMVRAARAGLEKGNLLLLSTEGSGGVYFMRDSTGHNDVGVFKPIDEEPMAENNPRGLPLSVDGEGMKRGTRVGEGALREVAAYILDRPLGDKNEIGFSGVPPTALVRCSKDGGKNYKVGSLQKFVKNIGSCEDMGPKAFPVQEVHKIAVLDIRLANADRHAGNILISEVEEEEDNRLVLVPIDHGYCLPENFEDCTFEWLYWPQAREPFNSEAVGYIKSLDAEEDIALLKFHGWDLSLSCARTLRISTMLLKKGAERALTPYDIGNIMCRPTLKKESTIEEIIRTAKDAVLPESSENTFLETVSEIMDRYLEKLFP